MIVCQISATDYAGGAGRAAHRLGVALRATGCRSIAVVQHKSRRDSHSIRVTPRHDTRNPIAERVFHLLAERLQKGEVDTNRSTLTRTIFSLDLTGLDLTDLLPVQAARIIHLHWTSFFQSPYSIAQLAATGVPLVWTLHDLWPLTGGCHYPAGCAGYETDCTACPQLLDDRLGLPAAMLAERAALWGDLGLTIVAPSRWIADCAHRSMLFRHCRIETIPNGLDTDILSPGNGDAFRRSLGIPTDAPLLAFGAYSLSDRRKGGDLLGPALAAALERLPAGTAPHILCFGENDLALTQPGITVHQLRGIDEDDRLAEVLRATDMLVLPSREDNYPNIMIEALACAVPVIGFDIGGIGEAVRDGRTGRLVPMDQGAAGLGSAIADLLADPAKARAMGQEGRRSVHPSHGLDGFAARMLALYEDLNPAFHAPVDPLVSAALTELDRIDTLEHPVRAWPLNRLGPHLNQLPPLRMLLNAMDR